MKYNKINDFLKLINSKAKKKRKQLIFDTFCGADHTDQPIT